MSAYVDGGTGEAGASSLHASLLDMTPFQSMFNDAKSNEGVQGDRRDESDPFASSMRNQGLVSPSMQSERQDRCEAAGTGEGKDLTGNNESHVEEQELMAGRRDRHVPSPASS